MNATEDAESLLKAGDLAGALSAVKAAIRKAPADADLRFTLFQMLSANGDWEGASNQLVAFSELTGRQSPMAIIFNDLIAAEVMRKLVFQGEKLPVIFGEPPEWVPLLVQACHHFAKGEYNAAMQLRGKALEEAPGVSGTCNGTPFTWMMDGDTRLGPLLELMMKGTYYWVPQQRVRELTFTEPSHLRDRVWMAVDVTFEGGGASHAYMPVRYPGAHAWNNPAERLARTTDWDSPAEGIFLGRGQRVFMTPDAEIPMLDAREIILNPVS
jgi:type VI secretion system protein ImpE